MPTLGDLLPPALATRLGIKLEKQQGIAVGIQHKYGKRIKPTFKSMIDYKESNPYVAAGIDELSEASVGSGFFPTAKNKDVLAYGEDWLETIDLDGMNPDISSDMWACGNSVLEKIDPRNLKTLVHLPIGSFERIWATKYGKITRVEQNIDGTRHSFENPQRRLILLRWKLTGTTVTGTGLLHSLMNQGVGYVYIDQNGDKKTVYRPSFQQISEEIEDAMRKSVIRYVPRFVYKFYGVPDNIVSSHATVAKSLLPADDLYIGLPKGDEKKNRLEIDRLQIDPRSKLDPFIAHFHNGVITGLETPSVRLFIEAGFTEASARTAVELRDQKVASFRRKYKRKIEYEIVKPFVVQQMGWKPTDVAEEWKAAEFRINWNPMKPPEVTNEQLVALFDTQAKSGIWVIRPEELRNMFKKRGIEIDDTKDVYKDEAFIAAKAFKPQFPQQQQGQTE